MTNEQIAVMRDAMETEAGLYPTVGADVHISTATWAYRGKFEVFSVRGARGWLISDPVCVFDTGEDLEAYFKTKKGASESKMPSKYHFIPEGAVISVQEFI